MLKGKRVVVIDDEVMITRLVGDVLKKLDAYVYTTNNPAEAFGLLAKAMPDLIILDRQMPKTNGLELLSQFKADYMYKHIPVIMLTAANKEGEIREAIKAGAVGYVIKPFKPSDLMKQIGNLLDKKDVWFID